MQSYHWENKLCSKKHGYICQKRTTDPATATPGRRRHIYYISLKGNAHWISQHLTTLSLSLRSTSFLQCSMGAIRRSLLFFESYKEDMEGCQHSVYEDWRTLSERSWRRGAKLCPLTAGIQWVKSHFYFLFSLNCGYTQYCIYILYMFYS